MVIALDKLPRTVLTVLGVVRLSAHVRNATAEKSHVPHATVMVGLQSDNHNRRYDEQYCYSRS